jgi:phenylpropionate dioxygenase-like ring-hydroxylating dioxygenase large terminal subunit
MPDDGRLFDPRTHAATRRPALEAETLVPETYTSPDFYRREVERIFLRHWNFMGRADQVPNPGDYFAVELAGVPLIVVRDQQGAVRAFANSCRHRGTQLVEGEGHCRAFKCPYHSWVYGLDGALIGTPEMDRTAGFDPAAYGLVPIKLETWGGFLFVNFDPASRPLAEHLGDLPEKLASYRLEDMVVTRRRVWEIGCNWKLFVENAMEEFHIPTVHRQTIQKNTPADTHAPETPRGQYAVLYSQHEGTMALLKGDTGFPRIASLQGRPAGGTYFVMVYPSTMFGFTTDCCWYLELRPQGPDRTTLVHGACFPRTTAARADFAEVVPRYYKRWDTTAAEDIKASEWQHRGLSSPLSRPGRFSYREVLVHEIDNWVLDQVLGAAPGRPAGR